MKKTMVLLMAAVFIAGCNVVEHTDKNGDKKVDIQSAFGGLKVRTGDVDAKDVGLSIYPGATLKPEDKKEDKDHRANVDLDTPWLGLKVVTVTMLSNDPPQKVWDFYKKDLSQYGSVLECKKGSPDVQKKRANDEDLICSNDNGDTHQGMNIQVDTDELKAGTTDRQHIVAVKPNGTGSEFTLVYFRKSDKKTSM